MRPGVDGELGLVERAHAAIALGDPFHAKERYRRSSIGSSAGIAARRIERRAPRGMRRGAGTAVADELTGFPSLWPMISCAVKLMPQVGKELPTKKLSDWSGK